MYQRLLFILTVLCISGAAMAQNVMTPTDGDYIYNPGAASGSLTNPVPAPVGTMQKWVHDPTQKNRIGSFQGEEAIAAMSSDIVGFQDLMADLERAATDARGGLMV